MTRLAAACLALSLAAAPAAAQEDRDELKEGMDLLSQGTKLLLEGLMKEMEPALRELRDALSDLDAYHPPEMLPNGDIILRRKRPLPETPPEDGGEIEL